MTERVTIVVNGDDLLVEPGTSIAELVGAVAPSSRGIAVALNGEVVPRSTWADAPISDGDRIEVLGAAQGG